MTNQILQSYRQGFHLLNKNIYIFWVNLIVVIAHTYLTHTSQGKISFLLILFPILTMTLSLANTLLLFTEPHHVKVVEAYVKVFYRYFFRIFFLAFMAFNIIFLVFMVISGDLASLQIYAKAFSSPSGTLIQKLISALPILIVLPIIPFVKIFWIIKEKSFYQSIISGSTYTFHNLTFSLIPLALSILMIVIQHLISIYFNKVNPLFFTIINIYLGLALSSASIVYFKSHKVER